LPILRDIITNTSKTLRIQKYKWCKEEEPGLIYPRDKMVQKMDDGSIKCLTCVINELKEKTVKVTLNSECTKKILAEEERSVREWNKRVTRLNKIFGQVIRRKIGLLVSIFNQITWWDQKTTTIQITKKTRDRLDAMGKRRESYDGYIKQKKKLRYFLAVLQEVLLGYIVLRFALSVPF